MPSAESYSPKANRINEGQNRNFGQSCADDDDDDDDDHDDHGGNVDSCVHLLYAGIIKDESVFGEK